MIYSNKQASVGLTSSWRCVYYYYGSWYEWKLLDTPTTASRTVTFDVSLPFDAVIKRVWMTMGISRPLSGSAFQRVNGIGIPSSGEVELPKEDFTAETTSYEAVFSFRANGMVFQDPNLHEATLTIVDPTLHIEYDSENEGTEDDDTTIVRRDAETGVQLPRLLGAGYRETDRLKAVSLRLEMNIDPKHRAVLKLPIDGAEVRVGDFVELFSPHGSAGLFRATEVQKNYGLPSGRTVYLEHAIGTLADSLAIGTQSMQAPVATVFATLLETQNVRHWVLGDCEVPENYELVYEYSYDNLLQAVTTLTKSLPPEYMWEFDTTRHPFVMHLRKLPEGDGCEMRMRRNLSRAQLTIDRNLLCTRIIPFGAGEGTDRVTLSALIGSQHIDSPTAEIWGLVSRTITADDVFDAPTLKIVAERYLERYSNPLVSVTMDAVDLYQATGEKLDYFRNGALCRLALPDYGVTMEERVIQVVWPDVYGTPERVDVTLANRIRDAADEIAELMREAKNIKLLGGTVETIEEFSRAGNIMPGSPFVQSFDITGYGNVLNVKTSYRCVTSDGREVNCHIRIDGNSVDDTEAYAKLVDLTKYLGKDENGVPTVGTHRITLTPATLNEVVSTVENTITIKQIGKR
ncbi:MAG: phage tail protein [Clostridia bacterium]|nr:phage tail protein [Clostridia bacterium]